MDAGLSEAIAARFRAAKIGTVGDLSKRLNSAVNPGPGEPGRLWRLTDVLGLTESQARKVATAIIGTRKAVQA